MISYFLLGQPTMQSLLCPMHVPLYATPFLSGRSLVGPKSLHDLTRFCCPGPQLVSEQVPTFCQLPPTPIAVKIAYCKMHELIYVIYD